MLADTGELLRHVNLLLAEQPLIVVEGKKDEDALRVLGLKNILPLTKPLYAVIEDVARRSSSVVILTDLDSKGKELYGTLSQGLRRHGVKVDDRFRRFLLRNTPLRHVEGLATFVQNRAAPQS